MESQKTLKESAMEYEPKTTYNVAELPSVDVDSVVLEDRSGTDEDGKPFYYKVIVVDGKEYRVPNSVQEKLKEALKIKPDIKRIKVNRTGSGLNTRYSIEVLE